MENRWHPMLAAVEGPTGTWRLIDPDGREYGRVEIRRVMNGAEIRYKAIWRGEVIGWATTLRLACERVHQAYITAHGPGMRSGAPMDWELRRNREDFKDTTATSR